MLFQSVLPIRPQQDYMTRPHSLVFLIHKQIPGIAATQIMEWPAPRKEEVGIAYQVLQLMMSASAHCTMLRVVLTEWKHICSSVSSQTLL